MKVITNKRKIEKRLQPKSAGLTILGLLEKVLPDKQVSAATFLK